MEIHITIAFEKSAPILVLWLIFLLATFRFFRYLMHLAQQRWKKQIKSSVLRVHFPQGLEVF